MPILFLVYILDLNFVIKKDSYVKVIGYFFLQQRKQPKFF